MNFRMTKVEAVASFRESWRDFLESNPNFRGDSIAKRCAFNDYVDMLNKDGMVTDYQAYNWSCLLYTSPSPRDNRVSRMPSSA